MWRTGLGYEMYPGSQSGNEVLRHKQWEHVCGYVQNHVKSLADDSEPLYV